MISTTHTVRVSERWASHTQCAAALDAPGVGENPAQVMELVDWPHGIVYVEPLGTVQVSLTHCRLGPGRRQGWAHRHRVAEEIYVALSEAGSQGLEVLAFGSHSSGDGEMVADRQRA